MKTGWIKSEDKWYYCEESGAMITGWRNIGGEWYYFDESGAMVVGWKTIDGESYHFSSNGVMETNKEIDNGWLNDQGIWNENKVETEVIEDETNQNITNNSNNTTSSTDAGNEWGGNTSLNSTLAITGFPELASSYRIGTTVKLGGVIESNHTITHVKIELVDHYMGKHSYSTDIYPDTKYFNLSSADIGAANTLYRNSTHTFTYVISAEDESGRRISFESNSFTLELEENADIEKENLVFPTGKIIEGSDFQLQGIIRSNYPITRIRLYIYSMKDGEKITDVTVNPFLNEVNLEEVFTNQYDISLPEPEAYKISISLSTGNSTSHTVVNNRFTVVEAPQITLYSINCAFYDRDGHRVITNSLDGDVGIVVKDAETRVLRPYKNYTRYVTFAKDKGKDRELNFVYAHSYGQVIDANSEERYVVVQHENGMRTKYSELDPENIYVSTGEWVDGKSYVGEFGELNYIKVELFDQNGNAIDILPYLNRELPE